MKNIDNTRDKFVHLYIALRRKKDNPDLPEQLCFREIDMGPDSLEHLRNRCKNVPGRWRIHRTINKRSTHKAGKNLQHKFIEDPEGTAERLPSVWKTLLMKRDCKAERNILLDIDSDKAYIEVTNVLDDNNIDLIADVPSVSGRHVVINAEKVDTRLFNNIENVEFKRDGYIFLEMVEGEK